MKLGDDPKEKRPPHYFSCIAECVGKKINIVSVNLHKYFIQEQIKILNVTENNPNTFITFEKL